MTEIELAARLARELGPLATDAGWSSAATTDQPQGHYSDPIADAKEAMAITGDLSDATLTAAQAIELRDRALLGCLERLELHYATKTDTQIGAGGDSQAQKLSQVQAAIAKVRARVDAKVAAAYARATDRSSAQGVSIRGRRRPDYTVGGGDEES
jgi:hypothetical protein